VDQATHNKIVSFIWGIADDVLRDLFKRGKYPDVILPMCVIRRLDAVLEPTKQAVLDMKQMLDEAGFTDRVPRCAVPRARRSTTRRRSGCATCGRGATSSNCSPTSRTT
jgi:type I restriction-modification system DNA methylase subunit